MRTSLLAALAALLSATAPVSAAPRHGLSTFGELSYGPDFAHFRYVDPDAPKGGRLALVGTAGRNTFDSFNGYILKGDPAQGISLLYESISLIFDSLMARAFDEPDSLYGLVARTADVAADGRSVVFELRPEARFADGSPLTADDVVSSFETLKKEGHPNYSISLRDVVEARADGPHRVTYRFEGEELRDLALVVAALPIFSKAYYATRKFGETTLEPPLGSGPYRIGTFKAGTFVSFQRRDDYWAKDLPVRRGQFNFDTIRFEYFRDRTAALESLKAGNFDMREEFTSRDWATAYDIPQVREGRLIKLVLPDERPSGTQGFFINTRRPHLADQRVRRALLAAFDFEWTNKNLFYSLYKRTHSYFENSELKAEGKPSPAELALLEPMREGLPPAVFGEAPVPPVSDGSGSDRRLLREAARLLGEAGYAQKDGRVVDARGQPLTIEFLTFEPSIERIILPYVSNLKLIGVEASIRRSDPAQYERRVKSFDFDVVVQRYVMSLTPDVSLKNMFSSEAADREGSFNLAGIKSPAVDRLISKVASAGSREDLVVAARTLDRVLRAGDYWVPHWYKASHGIVHWDRFGRPATKPRYHDGVLQTWWYDTAKAAKLDGK